MDTAVLPNDDFHTNSDDKLLETFSLIWLNANPKEDRNTEQQLRSIINHLKKFQAVKQCQKYIEQTSHQDRLVLIVSAQMGRQIISSIHKFRQVISIYVYCMDKKRNEAWASKYKKITAVMVDLDELICRIQADHKIQQKVDEPLSINIFTTNTNTGKSTIEVNGDFVFSQVLIDCLLRVEFTQTDIDELIDCCKRQYEGNQSELDHIDEFAQTYSPDKALCWYTRESFFYKTLNAALRKSDIHMIFLFRGFIHDIHQQLQNHRSKNRLRVYRGQMISTNELNILNENIGQFISVNSFFSTSTDYKTALSFLNMSTSSDDLEQILFQIDADPKMVCTKPFADISKYSVISQEAEVLFMTGSTFRLERVDRNDDDDVWIIQMTLCNDDEHDLKQVFMYMKQQIESEEMNLRTLGKLLREMGKFGLAEKYVNRLLKELSPNDPLIHSLYEDLGKLAALKGEYNMSVEWHQKAIEFKNKHQPTVDVKSKQTNKSSVIKAIPRITHNTQWRQNGMTVAGGNGGGDKLNQLNWPHGLSIDNDQQSIYIADCYNHRIFKWKFNTRTGKVVAGGNGRGNEMNQLNEPTDVAVDRKNDSLIICDRQNRRVVEWSRRNGTKDGQILISDIDCYGITIDQNGYIYVSDTAKNEVRRWERGETTNGMIVAGGNGEGNHLNQLHSPTYLFVDQDDSLYISDQGNHRVMKWMKDAKEGIIVAGGRGQGDQLTQLSYPQGVIVDHLGNIYVADSWNNRIMCWSKGSKQGRIIVGRNERGKQLSHLNGPYHILFDRENNLYVVDCWNHRVQKFEIDKY